jgi:hypothetical protein
MIGERVAEFAAAQAPYARTTSDATASEDAFQAPFRVARR